MKGKVIKIEPIDNEVRVICASGTPVPESPVFAHPFLKLVDKDLVPDKARFEKHFVVKEPRQIWIKKRKKDGKMGKKKIRIMEVVGFKNLDQLKVLIQNKSIRRLQEEVEGMPEEIIIDRYIDMTPGQKKVYDDIKEGLLKELKEVDGELTWMEIAAKTLRMRQVLNSPALIGIEGIESAKHIECDDILEEVLSNPDAKVIIWSNWVTAIEMLIKRYKDYKAKGIYGKTTKTQFDEQQQNFATNDTRVLVCTPDKAGTGVDFLQRARFSIYIERNYSAVMDAQSVDRINRRGAKGASVIIRIKVRNSADQLVDYVVDRKQGMSEALVTSKETLVKVGKQELLKFLE